MGEIIDDEMQLNDAGRIIQSVWNEIALRYPQVELDEFVIMPNHVHGIINIRSSTLGAGRKLAPEFDQPFGC